MKKEIVIENSLHFLGVNALSCNYKALNLFLKYQEDFAYIKDFLEKMSFQLNSKSAIEIKNFFDELNLENWREIDSYALKESEYYIFLRLKVFLLTIDLNSDVDEDNEWFDFFEKKYIQ